MAALIVTGGKPSDIAQQFGVTPSAVRKLKSRLRTAAPASFDYRSAREQLRQAAYPAVQAGLEGDRFGIIERQEAS